MIERAGGCHVRPRGQSVSRFSSDSLHGQSTIIGRISPVRAWWSRGPEQCASGNSWGQYGCRFYHVLRPRFSVTMQSDGDHVMNGTVAYCLVSRENLNRSYGLTIESAVVTVFTGSFDLRVNVPNVSCGSAIAAAQLVGYVNAPSGATSPSTAAATVVDNGDDSANLASDDVIDDVIGFVRFRRSFADAPRMEN